MLGPGDSPLESVIRLSSQISGTSQPTGRGDVSLEELADLHQMGLPPRHGISHVSFIASPSRWSPKNELRVTNLVLQALISCDSFSPWSSSYDGTSHVPFKAS